jgi:hypothetical protein
MRGALSASFAPATSGVEVITDEVDFIPLTGNVNGDELRDRDTRRMRREFEQEIQLVADRGLQRLSKPQLIEPAWKVTQPWRFGYVLR